MAIASLGSSAEVEFVEAAGLLELTRWMRNVMSLPAAIFNAWITSFEILFSMVRRVNSLVASRTIMLSKQRKGVISLMQLL